MVNIAIYERGETFVHRVTIRDRDGVKTNPTTITETIYDPCGAVIVNALSMTSDATGEYFYNHNLSSSATYGRYRTHVVSVTGTVTSIFDDEFFIMPWKLEADIRRTTGISDKKSIEDDDLSHIAWKAYLKALRDVYRHYKGETPLRDPDTGAAFNGTNTSFQTAHHPIADINGDGTVSGTNVSCATDVTVWWINSAGSRQEGRVTITNVANGEISIFQSDGTTAIPNTNEGVYLDYWAEYESFDDVLLQEGVVYLAAHNIYLRLNEADRVTIGDVAGNIPIIVKDEHRWKREYKDIMNMIREPRCGVV